MVDENEFQQDEQTTDQAEVAEATTGESESVTDGPQAAEPVAAEPVAAGPEGAESTAPQPESAESTDPEPEDQESEAAESEGRAPEAGPVDPEPEDQESEGQVSAAAEPVDQGSEGAGSEESDQPVDKDPSDGDPSDGDPSDSASADPAEGPRSVTEPETGTDQPAGPVEEAAPRRRRRTASRPAGPPVHVEPESQPSGTVAAGPATSSDEISTTETTTGSGHEHTAEGDESTDAGGAVRRHRRATRGVTTVAFSAPADVAPSAAVPLSEAPAIALFQPPDPSLAAPPKRKRKASAKQAADTEPREQAADVDPGADAEAPEPADQAQIPLEETPVPTPAPVDAERDAEGDDEGVGPDGDAPGEDDPGPRRRRRRGGRRRRRPNGGPDAEQDAEQDEVEPGDAGGGEQAAQPAEDAPAASGDDGSDREDEPESEGAGSKRRRRRRRRAGVSEEMEDLSSDDVSTVVKVREGRRGAAPSDEITALRGSARIEAKKQRRRDGREAGRRRAPILTEAEFLARREAVDRVMCLREFGGRTQIAVLEDGVLAEHYVSRQQSASMVGNVYLGRVQNVLPSMEAAFVDIGRGRNAVLYAGEVNWDAAGLDGQPKRIEFALKSGDPVLVQVTKDPMGHKGARLTSQISLPGRFLVYVPEGSMTGISRKLPDTERARLKAVLKEVVPDGAGVIVRTAAEGATEEQLTADVDRLNRQWADITKKAGTASPPTLLYGEPDLAIKVVRDIFNEDFNSLLVQGDETWTTLQEYVGRVAPDLMGRLQKWVESTDLYTAHRIDEQLAKALDRKVWLPSGGSLVIDRTEAMTVVDVNTGKFTGQGGSLEETVTSNNLEAAEEIVRQLRLRDIGGIIVVDFIDMVLESNRDLVLRRLLECLGRDRTRHQVAEVTSLGLVQMTRKRIGQGLLEVFSTPCEHCGGRGHLVHTEPVGIDPQVDDPNVRGGRDRGRSRAGRPAAPLPAHLGGKQTGKTPPPPKFDENGHIDHSGEALAELEFAESPDHSTDQAVAAGPSMGRESGMIGGQEPIEFEGDLDPVERDLDPVERDEDQPTSPTADHLDLEAV